MLGIALGAGPCSLRTNYKWGYLYEALEVDGDNRIELLLAPLVGMVVSNVFLQKLAATNPDALHLVV